jgi:beta-lactamase class A
MAIITAGVTYKHASEIIPAHPINHAAETPRSTVRVGRLSGSTASSSTMLALGKQIEQYMQKDHDMDGSVYIEDLSNHLMVNVGTSEQYNAKSLMKTPLVMTLYKAAELGRLNLDDMQTISKDELDPGYGDLYLAGAGTKITLRQAAVEALEQSDNTAIKVINDKSFPVMPRDERAYLALNLDLQIDDNKQTYITARSYATVFRCLYTACYLNRQNSDDILAMMEKTEFNDPAKYLPKGTLVSHKIGDNAEDGYNDCGIVFGAKKPFIFCIMLKESVKESSPDISQIVKTSYDFLEK